VKPLRNQFTRRACRITRVQRINDRIDRHAAPPRRAEPLGQRHPGGLRGEIPAGRLHPGAQRRRHSFELVPHEIQFG
jgi:hypothetical protein